MNIITLLHKDYEIKKKEIRERLDDFSAVWDESEERVFSELCFCICTPQSKAVYCDKAVRSLVLSGVLFKGREKDIRDNLKAVRFPNNKAGYIYRARLLFTDNGSLSVKKHIDPADIPGTRTWLFKNVKGLGMKEASHFLRNIGFGKEIAIVDVHILRKMLYYGLLKEIPKTISAKVYVELEDSIKGFSSKTGIRMDELDLLFWSQATGHIFK
ncbi:MAG: N-glycosylase/DNA lyase [Candidatus Omnitrophica bacterium]|nr:N-glycosylase/DNA lyase [Candidatus Omnitrophota bacterium]